MLLRGVLAPEPGGVIPKWLGGGSNGAPCCAIIATCR
jgi:hypothetical protein